MGISSRCDILQEAANMAERDKNVLKKDARGSLVQTIGSPDSTIVAALENSKKQVGANRKKIDKRIDLEKKRFKAHDDFFNYLQAQNEESIDMLGPLFDVKQRERFIKGMIGYKVSYYGDMNNSADWDASTIKTIHRFFKELENFKIKAEKDSFLSTVLNKPKYFPYLDTILNPILAAARLDQSGLSTDIVMSTIDLTANYMRASYEYTNTLNDISQKVNILSERNELEGDDVQDLLEHLLDKRVMNVLPIEIPTDPKAFHAWRNGPLGTQFYTAVKYLGRVHNIKHKGEAGDYIFIPISREGRNKELFEQLIISRRTQQKKSGDRRESPHMGEEVTLAYRIPSQWGLYNATVRNKSNYLREGGEQVLSSVIDKNNLDEGFYMAKNDEDVPTERIKGTDGGKRKKRYGNYSWMEDQPSERLMSRKGLLAEYSLWDLVQERRDFNEMIYDVLYPIVKGQEENLDLLFKTLKGFLSNTMSNEEVQEILDEIYAIGGVAANTWIDDEKGLYSANSFLRKADRDNYAHVQYWGADRMDMLEQASFDLKNKIKDNDSLIEGIDIDLQDASLSQEERQELMELRGRSVQELNLWKEQKDGIDTIMNVDLDNASSIKEMAAQSRMTMFKNRSILFDRTRRRTDAKVTEDYVTNAFRTIEINKIKENLIKASFTIQNPFLMRYLVDQVRLGVGSKDTEAGFLGIPYGNENIANFMNYVKPWGKKLSSKDIQDTFIFGLLGNVGATFASIGWLTALGNLTQVNNDIIDLGWTAFMEANNVRQNGGHGFSPEQWQEFVIASGARDPLQMFTDVLTGGLDNTGGADFIIPFKDMAILKLAKSKFVGEAIRNASWKHLVAVARGEDKVERKTLQEFLKRYWELVHDDGTDKARIKKVIDSLEMNITQGLKNRLVAWKLAHPLLGPQKIITMKGSEEWLRDISSISGFLLAKKLKQVDLNDDQWPLQDAAIDMARLETRNQMFGMNQASVAKFMRGGFGRWFWLWKPFEWHQVQRDWNVISNDVLADKDPNGHVLMNALSAASRVITFTIWRGPREAIRVIKEVYNKNDMDMNDKTARRLLRFFFWKGIPTAFTIWMQMFGPITEVISYLTRSRLFSRAKFGLESPLIMRAYHLTLLFALFFGASLTEDEDDTWRDIVRGYFPPILGAMLTFIINGGDNIYQFLFEARAHIPHPARTALDYDRMRDPKTYEYR